MGLMILFLKSVSSAHCWAQTLRGCEFKPHGNWGPNKHQSGHYLEYCEWFCQ